MATLSAPAAELDAECILTKLRSRCLRLLSNTAAQQYQGLAVAARANKKDGRLNNNLCRKLVQLDETCAWLRHASEKKALGFFDKLQHAVVPNHPLHPGDLPDPSRQQTNDHRDHLPATEKIDALPEVFQAALADVVVTLRADIQKSYDDMHFLYTAQREDQYSTLGALDAAMREAIAQSHALLLDSQAAQRDEQRVALESLEAVLQDEIHSLHQRDYLAAINASETALRNEIIKSQEEMRDHIDSSRDAYHRSNLTALTSIESALRDEIAESQRDLDVTHHTALEALDTALRTELGDLQSTQKAHRGQHLADLKVLESALCEEIQTAGHETWAAVTQTLSDLGFHKGVTLGAFDTALRERFRKEFTYHLDELKAYTKTIDTNQLLFEKRLPSIVMALAPAIDAKIQEHHWPKPEEARTRAQQRQHADSAMFRATSTGKGSRRNRSRHR